MSEPAPIRETVIGNRGADHVLINAWGKPNLEGWFSAEVKIACEGWRGKFLCSLQKGELRALAEELQRLENSLNGEATFHPLEPNLILAFSGDGKGHINVKGEAQERLGSGTRLAFEFEIDQTYLRSVISDLLIADPA